MMVVLIFLCCFLIDVFLDSVKVGSFWARVLWENHDGLFRVLNSSFLTSDGCKF